MYNNRTKYSIQSISLATAISAKFHAPKPFFFMGVQGLLSCHKKLQKEVLSIYK